MKCSCTACCLEAIAAHYFQGMFAQCRAVGREQNMAVSLCQSESVNQQVFEIMFDLKRLSSGRTRKSWRIKNDHVEFLTFPYQPRQDGPDVIRDKAVLNCWKEVEGKILASPSQIVFRRSEEHTSELQSQSNLVC